MNAVVKALLLLVGILVLAGVAVVLYVMQTGLSARDQPGAIESAVAGGVRRLAVARNARDLRNPVERTPQAIADARAHFADHCAVCHANDGSGETEIGQGLWPKAPDMRSDATQGLSDGELFYIIEEGIRFTGMPGWSTGTKEGEEASWQLVHFIRHLPNITEAELEEMEAMNPRPPAEIREEIEAERFLAGDDSPSAAPAPPHDDHHGRRD
jgi:mono/diheme cytochrome c family protein